MLRMDDKRVVTRILETKPEGRRKVGRPRTRWLNRVEEDLRQLRNKWWRLKALNKEEWAIG